MMHCTKDNEDNKDKKYLLQVGFNFLLLLSYYYLSEEDHVILPVCPLSFGNINKLLTYQLAPLYDSDPITLSVGVDKIGHLKCVFLNIFLKAVKHFEKRY